MAPIDELAIPAGETVSLEPGGAHFMLIGLADGMTEENKPMIRLEFKNTSPQEIALEVRDGGGGHHH